ncbi:MAG: MFS transporter, partial [Acidobacteriota bacterium]|nr:MFS transporter [Acidobacteriota bacterium]
YTFFGIPLGRLADSKSRRTIIAFGFILWSLFTAGCGLAKNFWQMLLMRMGVGVGEASLSPAAYSMISDYFPPQRRATAISVYSMGIYIGSGLAFLLGGTVVAFATSQEAWNLPLVGMVRPWQVIFFIVGLPGILFAWLLYTVREPVRRGMKLTLGADGKSRTAQVPFPEVIAYLRLNWKTYLCHNVGFALLSFSSYGSTAWIPTFFVRNHGWTEARAGIVYGSIVAVFGALGITAGGWLADRMAKSGSANATMKVGLIAALAWVPTGMVYPLVPSATWAAVLLAPTVFMVAAPFGVAPAAIQQITPNPMRAQASAIYLFAVNLIGLGLGPTAVAVFTDYVFHDDNAVRYSILIVGTAAHLVSAVLLWIGLRPFNQSLDRVREWAAKPV